MEFCFVPRGFWCEFGGWGVTEIIVQSRELVSGYTYEICMHGTVWLMLVVRLN